jgi:transposase InsO family protein
VARSLEVSRSNIYARLRPRGESVRRICEKSDKILLPKIKSIASERPGYGYRRVTAVLNRETKEAVNHKRVYRIMKENQLLLQRHERRTRRAHTGKIVVLRSNTRWCSDSFRVQAWDGSHVEVAFSKDCCDREVIAWAASTRGIDGGLIRDLMAMSVEKRFPDLRALPQTVQWLSDNGSGYTANKTVAFGRSLGFDVVTTPAYSPQSNGMAEAFVKRFKYDYVYHKDLSSAEQILEQLDGWFEDYNEHHPHKGLGMKSPREYLRANAAR